MLFTSNNYNLLIDAGDGISRALINERINFNSISGILFTHLHPDHFSGLPVLVVQMKMTNRKETLEIFVHQSLLKVVKEFLINSYLLPERMEFEIEFKTFNNNKKFKVSEDFYFTARKNTHLKDLEMYQSEYPELSLYSASFLFESETKKIIYTSDIGSDEDLLLFKEVKPDLFISEVTHISIQSILKGLEELQPALTYLTHYSDEEIPLINENLANLSDNFRDKVILAVDNNSVEF
jgi:ribonuclease Z